MRFIAAGAFKFGAPDSDDLKNFGDFDVGDVSTGGYCIDVYESPNKAKVKPTETAPSPPLLPAPAK